MSKRELENLAKIGKLKAESGTPAEFDDLVGSARKRLADAQNEKLSAESRFDLTYNAAHAFALAALRRHRYRPENRYVVFFNCTTRLAAAVAALDPPAKT
jgi:hypothetical protein